MNYSGSRFTYLRWQFDVASSLTKLKHVKIIGKVKELGNWIELALGGEAGTKTYSIILKTNSFYSFRNSKN